MTLNTNKEEVAANGRDGTVQVIVIDRSFEWPIRTDPQMVREAGFPSCSSRDTPPRCKARSSANHLVILVNGQT